MNKERVREFLRTFDFEGLFLDGLGWDALDSTVPLIMGDQTITLQAIAEKRGMTVYLCPMPAKSFDYPSRCRIEAQLAKCVREHLIVFTDQDRGLQIWQWVKREPEKPLARREHVYNTKQTGNALIQKLEYLRVTLEEEEKTTLPDVTGKAKKAFDLEKITKRFYDRFKTEHAAFLKFIEGIPDEDLERWYASVMINRLMFIYFIQKKGFLDSDKDYLRTKLNLTKDFYSAFLCPLFFDGFAKKESERSPSTNKLLGKVPYLNGGIFQPHQIEQHHGKTIDIPNKAFDNLFAFFDEWGWHLDDRPTHNDNEIGPDVLGYIFEKYINQKQMGAYYTKEDITEYISKNTIISRLFDMAKAKCKVAFEGEHSIWTLLKADPDRYIYDAVKHGADKQLPEKIAIGLKDVSKRGEWNTSAPSDYALPTEIWRETVARRQRYEEVRKKLTDGEVRDINEFITLNLNIRQFAQDVVENCEGPELLVAFWNAIESITVLDPTCGSGAFLFAALNILEPLYEACLDRMQAFLDEWGEQGKKKHPNYHKLFTETLDRVEHHPNRRYFIFKSIIVNNLYGVDIMDEAVEICKLRLFLKLVAQVDAAERIEPLPDIDFNIRSGNTLVGFATKQQVEDVLRDDLLAYQTVLPNIIVQAEDIDSLFARFREQQTKLGGEVTPEDKAELRKKLAALEDDLNRYLAQDCGVDPNKIAAFSKWLKSHQPFHWFIDFYGIMNSGGFDVIIGNPPYAEIPKDLGRSLLRKTFKSVLERWSRDENLYTLVVERSLRLLKSYVGKYGMILPLSVAFSTKKPFVVLRNVLATEKGVWLWSHFDRIPSALFGNDVRTRCTVALLYRTQQIQKFEAATTALLRWNAEYRDCLFKTLHYAQLNVDISAGIPKVASQIQADVLKGLLQTKSPLAMDLLRSVPFHELANAAPNFPQPCVYVGGTAYNWFPAWRDIPETTNMDGEPSLPARTAGFRFANEEQANIVFALLCSSMGYWWWAVASDAFNLKKWLMERFPVSVSMIPVEVRKPLAKLGENLRRELKRNYVYKDNKGRIGNYFLPACEKEIVAIDTFLGTAVPMLSVEFFQDVRNFNATFSRAELGEEEEDDE